jgi:hypothetical protein
MKLLNNLHGLNNDVSYITSVLASSAQKDAIFGNSSDMVTDYYRNLQLVNQARESKEEFKNALSIAQTKNSLGDVATTMDGLIIVKNKKDGSLTAMAPE